MTQTALTDPAALVNKAETAKIDPNAAGTTIADIYIYIFTDCPPPPPPTLQTQQQIKLKLLQKDMT